MDLLDKLAKQKLKQPKGLRQFIWHNTSYRTRTWGRYHCVETMEKWNGTWILRVFAYRQMPEGECTYKNIRTMEVQRIILGHKEYLSTTNAYNTAMGGRYINWDQEVEFFRCKKNWEWFGYKMYSTQEIIDNLDIPYCSWDQFNEDYGSLRFIDYISLYIKEPRIERLVKLGFSKYITSLRYLDLSKRKIYDVFKLDKKWEFVIGELEIGDILTLRREKEIENLDDLELYNIIHDKSWNRYPKIKELTKFKKLKEYRLKEMSDHHDLYIYEDYLRFASELGYDTRRNNILYPSNLSRAHDQLMNEHNNLLKERERQKIEANKSKFSKQYKKNKKHKFVDDGFIITPVRTQDELIEESKVLNHCVRTYAEQIVNGTTEILFVRKNEEPDIPFITVEVKNNTVTQVRGINNSTPPEIVVEFLKEWSNKNKINYIY